MAWRDRQLRHLRGAAGLGDGLQSLHSPLAAVEPGAPVLASALGAGPWAAHPGAGQDPAVTQPGATRVPCGRVGIFDRNRTARRSRPGARAFARAAHAALLGAEPHLLSGKLALGREASAHE